MPSALLALRGIQAAQRAVRSLRERRMEKMLTPLHLEIVLHYYSRAHDMENANAPAVCEYVKHLLEAGILTETSTGPKSYRTTPKGDFWLHHLLETPFPVSYWKIPNG